MEFETVIGLEIHAQLLTQTKIFCGCAPVFGDAPNTHTCPVCLGMPGSLPVLNRSAVEMAVLMGKAVNCTISEKSVFARKNYFYPDLPKGYQISQYDMPLCQKGFVDIEPDGEKRRIGITRIHLEEDAGKLIHDQDPDSLFDANRCGTPLMEIVSEPEMHTPREAYLYLTAIKQTLGYLQICDCNMEEGSLRCDVNVSLRPKGETKLGTKIELKNMNTFRGVEKALEYEIKRQKEILESGGSLTQQTFLWDAQAGKTAPMRDKESAHDYRYFPDPDLMPLIIDKSLIDGLEKQLPESASSRRERFMRDFGLSREHADLLTDSRQTAEYFETTVISGADPKAAAVRIMVDIMKIMKDTGLDINKLSVTPTRLAALIKLISAGTVSDSVSRRILEYMQNENCEASVAVEKLQLAQISDSSELEKAVQEVIASNPAECARFKAGETKLMSFFVGQAMKKTRGKGNPREINAIATRLLNS
jgi:aspartyl-tRNA(Asn)/glutamyl-tRNA(Gln) amidotransferase subunit B